MVKASINTQEAAQAYGIDANHHGMALCPFRNDRHPSLYVSDDHYYCFACGEHGDVIDLTAKLFDLRLYDAVRKLASDFHLAPDKPLPEAIRWKKKHKTKAQQLRENEQLCFSVLNKYQVDNDGEGGEISFDFEAGAAEIVRLAECDTIKTSRHANRAIMYLLNCTNEKLPKEMVIALEV